MRNPDRIDTIIEMLRVAWKKNPDMRLCQLVYNVGTKVHGDIFYAEDEEFEKSLAEIVVNGWE